MPKRLHRDENEEVDLEPHDHVRVGQGVPVTTAAAITSVVPLCCEHCGSKTWIGMPISIPDLVAITKGYTQFHKDCRKQPEDDSDD